MSVAYDPAYGASARPTVVLDPSGRAKALVLRERLIGGARREIDRDLHALLFPDQDARTPIPRYSTSADSILRLIEVVLPRWVHGYTYMPGSADDQDFEVRGWVAGPGYITDEHTRDYHEGEAPAVAAALTMALLSCLSADVAS